MYLSENLGLVNRNPGNIRYSSINWQGQTGEYAGFVVFKSMAYGYRALMKNLQAYINEGNDTIQKMISKWCPPGEGCDTASYIQHVSERTGINKNKRISAQDLDSLSALAAAISISEIGTVDPGAIDQAVQMLAGGSAGTAQTRKPKTGLIIATTLLLIGGAYAYNRYYHD